ncbi:MAG: histidine kinase [Mucilaginibacter sp.]|uniref:sensor histidine kinase n=1 Tax=Mucilaginibacter sp. TaxID=1882438 RepID=UPI00319FB997
MSKMAKWRVIPYIVLIAFSFVTSVVRVFALPELDLLNQAGAFLFQISLFTLSWTIIRKTGAILINRLPNLKDVIKRTILQIVISLVLIIPLGILLVYYIQSFHLPVFTRPFIVAMCIAFFIFVVVLNLSYSAFYFFLNWQNSITEKAQLQIEAAELGKDKLIMKYHNLKNQVNPHFLFNTFTSLDGLIQTDPVLASEFVRQLSKVYRYVLQNKENEVVNLQTEVDFIEHYIYLLQIRYKELLLININLSDIALEKGIVMVTLQMLIDNAIKHNSLQVNSPLNIEIWDDGSYLHVKNNKQLRKQIETSNKQGLQQLRELYSFLTSLPIAIDESEAEFEIRLPLL